MLVERLTLRQFRNYGEVTVAVAPGGAYITGANGSGKTNLLEAIYYLANQMSFRTAHREELQGGEQRPVSLRQWSPIGACTIRANS